MKETQLPESVSGEKLVQILEEASSNTRFEFRKVKGEKTLPDCPATYYEPVTPLIVFSDKHSRLSTKFLY